MEENVMVKKIALTFLVALVATVSFATSEEDEVQTRVFGARLHGYNEVPSVSTAGRGRFAARLSEDGTALAFTLRIARLSTPVIRAHIHFGQSKTEGGIMVPLCRAQLPDDPADHVRACIDADGTISGIITAADVVGPGGQGIAKGEFRELIRALRAGAGYVNVHTLRIPSGEIRGQIR